MNDELLRRMLEEYDGGVDVKTQVAELEKTDDIQRFHFKVGDHETGPREVVALATPGTDAAPEPPKPVEKPEESRFVKNDRELSFEDYLREDAEVSAATTSEAEARARQIIANHPRLMVLAGLMIVIVVFAIVALGTNYLSGGTQYTGSAPTTAPEAPGATVGVTVGATVIPTQAPQSAPTSGACEGTQGYFAPNLDDVGPCIAVNEKLVPIGRYGSEGWIFMTLANGSKLWVQLADAALSGEQIGVLKDYKAVPTLVPVVQVPAPQIIEVPVPVVVEVTVIPTTEMPDTRPTSRTGGKPKTDPKNTPVENIRVDPIHGRPGVNNGPERGKDRAP